MSFRTFTLQSWHLLYLIDIRNQMLYNIKQVNWRWLMTTSEQIRVLCVRTGVSLSELARKIGQTPQNFSTKLKRGTINQEEMLKIANALDVKYEQFFLLPSGDRIE